MALGAKTVGVPSKFCAVYRNWTNLIPVLDCRSFNERPIACGVDEGIVINADFACRVTDR